MNLHVLTKERLNFLIVDPSESICQLLEAMLTPVKASLTFAGNADDGLVQAQSFWPDVIIADYSLDGSGAVLCERVRRDPMLCRTPFILMTAFTNQISPAKYLESGCDQIVYKPFKCMEMYKAIRSAIRHTAVEGRGTMIPVLYKTGQCDHISPKHLDKMIREKEIACFRRSDGVVIIGRDPVRTGMFSIYDGPERRWAAA
jgi:DNA-binding response OmpR family regulator